MRVPRVLLLLGLLAAVLLPGCGSGGTISSPPAPNASLFAPNYVTSVSLLHWNHLPMRVSFNLPSNWNQLYSANPTLQVDAANEWNKTGQQALIQVVGLGSQADVVVTFVSESTLSSQELGITNWTYDPSTNLIQSTTIQIADVDMNGQAFSAALEQLTIAHELGHALGIDGHSPLPADVMYYQASNPPKFVTTRDLNTIMTAYPTYFGAGFTTLEVPHAPGPLVTRSIN